MILTGTLFVCVFDSCLFDVCFAIEKLHFIGRGSATEEEQQVHCKRKIVLLYAGTIVVHVQVICYILTQDEKGPASITGTKGACMIQHKHVFVEMLIFYLTRHQYASSVL